MNRLGVHLQYSFDPSPQSGAQVRNPLFDLLWAVRENGSIQHAAKALGLSYRHVWGSLKQWQEVLGEPLVSWSQGQPARLTPFAERLVWAETRARTRLTPHIEALRVELERALAEARDGEQDVLTVCASHDLALSALRELAWRQQRLHVELRGAGSIDALRALADGRCPMAGFHLPPGPDATKVFAQTLKPLLKASQHRLIALCRREQGLLVAPGNPLALRTLADVVRTGARFVPRQAGSGTRLLTEHLLLDAGLPADALKRSERATEDSHLAVAATIASGLGDVGMGIQAAAQTFGLAFVPMAHEDYFLVGLKDALDHPAVLKLRAVLGSAEWQQTLATVPGYEAPAIGAAGEVLSLTKALPWWHFRQAKASVAPLGLLPAG